MGAFVSKRLSSALYHFLNARLDAEIYQRLYNRGEIEKLISSSGAPERVCDRYDEPDVISWINDLNPDILVVHSATFVPRSVRKLAKRGLVIGGHPGLTQFFRGGSSSFHAVYQGRLADIGWTVFHLEKGIDTGDIISQGRLQIQPGDSFETLDWRAMLCIAEEQARLIRELDQGNDIPRCPYGPVEANTLYWYPRVSELIKYRLKQKTVR